MSRETILRSYLNEIKKPYDYILIDCRPTLGMLVINSLTAADSVINPNLSIDGAVLTMVNNTNFSKDTAFLLRRDYGERINVFSIEMPLSEIDDFPEHPSKVRIDEAMQDMVESIKKVGVLTPAIVRKKEDGRYEILSGHIKCGLTL